MDINIIGKLTVIVIIIQIMYASPTSVSAEITYLNPIFLAGGIDNGPQDGIFDEFQPAGQDPIVNNNSYQNYRIATEYDISSIPMGSIINSATLTLRIGVWDGPRSVQLHGYSGNGTSELTDFEMNDLIETMMLQPTGNQYLNFDIQNFIDDLITTGQTAGFNLREEPPNFSNFVVMSIDHNIGQLTVDFAPPVVPALANICILGLLFFLGCCIKYHLSSSLYFHKYVE